MSWFGKKKKDEPAPEEEFPEPEAVEDTTDYNHINGLLSSTDRDIDVELTEEDMNDPELLRQLREMGGDEEEEAPAAAAPARKTEAQLNAELTKTKQEAVALNKAGRKEEAKRMMMQIKSLQAEIASYNSMPAPTAAPARAPAAATQRPAAKPAAAKKMDADQIMNMVETQPHEDGDVEVELTEDDLKDPYLLAQLRELGGEVEDHELAHATQEPVAAAPARKVSAAPAGRPVPSTAASADDLDLQDDEPPAKRPAARTADPELQLRAVDQRISEYKMAAVNAKKAGNMDLAKQCMVNLKTLQGLKETLDTGIPVDSSKIPPPVASLTGGAAPAASSPAPAAAAPVATTAAAPAAARKKSAAASAAAPAPAAAVDVTPLDNTQANDALYNTLTSQLTTQIATMQKLARVAYEVGDKNGAVVFHKDRKAMQADLDSVLLYRTQGRPVPRFHYENKTYQQEYTFPSISDVELEVVIVRAIHVHLPDGYKEIEPYALITFPFQTNGRDQTAQSAAVKGTDPEFNFTTRFAIERGKKSFTVALPRKKINIELFISRFLRSAISLGHVEVPFNELMNQAECEMMVDLLGSNKRPCGGKLEVILRARTPLGKDRDLRSVTERWIVVDEFNGEAAPAPVAAPAAKPAAKPAAETRPARAVSTEKPPATSTSTAAAPAGAAAVGGKAAAKASPATAKAAPAAAPAAAGGDDDEEDDPNAVDKMISNAVLEWEVNRITELLPRAPPAERDDLVARKEEAELKMQMLMVQVQTGTLTIPQYVERLQAKVGVEKAQAVAFNKAGKKEWAAMALKRLKLMEQEIKDTLSMAE